MTVSGDVSDAVMPEQTTHTFNPDSSSGIQVYLNEIVVQVYFQLNHNCVNVER